MTVVKTYSTPPRADLKSEDFNKLIFQKGRTVILEKTVRCPCKSKSTNQKSTCMNCGGSGWIFLNPKNTKMIITSMAVSTDYKAWSEESRGTVNFTCTAAEQVNSMDRITVIDGLSYFNEVLHIRHKDGVFFAFTVYPVKRVLYASSFKSDNEKLVVMLPADVQTPYNNSVVHITPGLIGEEYITRDGGGEITDVDFSITIRYLHNPAYVIIDSRRESMQSSTDVEGLEVLQQMPVTGLARKLHYEPDAPNYDSDRNLDNSYEESDFYSLCEELEEDCLVLLYPNADKPAGVIDDDTAVTTRLTDTTEDTYYYYGLETATLWTIVRVNKTDLNIRAYATKSNNTEADLTTAWATKLTLTYT